MFDFNLAPKKISISESVTFNFNTGDFDSMITESDRSINGTINSYRTLMTEALTESAGVLNEDTTLIMEQANEHVGQKIMKVLNAIKDWIIKTLKSLTLKIQTLVVSNKRLVDKIKPTVEDKLKNGDLKGFKVEMYKYTLDAVNIDKLISFFSKEQQMAVLGIKTSFDGNDANSRVETQLKAMRDMSTDDIKLDAAKNANVKVPDAKDIEMETRKLLRGQDTKETLSFSMAFFNTVENFASVEQSIQQVFKLMTDQVDDISKQFKDSVKDVKPENDSDKAYQSKLLEAFNVKRRFLSVVLSTAVMLNNLKLQAAVEQMNNAKKACVQAYHYKSVQEGAVDGPYEPYLDIDDDSEDQEFSDDDLDDSLNESAKTVW